MINHLLTILMATFAFPFYLLAQPSDLLPVSPEAAALTKMVEYPINMNTGVPDISIPFYEINVGGLKLPITLQYHAGGFRINEQATRTGLGWSLSSDLQITRTIKGLDDFENYVGYIQNSYMKAFYPNYSTCPSCAYPSSNSAVYALANGDRDGSPDQYTYKLLNKSGSFYFQKSNNGTGYTIVPVPYDNIKIEFDNGMFTITDIDGTVYYFGDTGTGEINQAEKGIEFSKFSGSNGQGKRTAWKCKRIVNSIGTDEIVFTYALKSEAHYRTYSDRVEYYNNESPCGLSWEGYYTSNNYPMNIYSDYDLLVGQIPFHRISSPKYMVTFGNSAKSYFHVPYLNVSDEVVDKVYERVGVDVGQSTTVIGISMTEIVWRGGKVLFSGTDKLNSIRVLDYKGTEVKALNFFHSYTQAAYIAESKFYNGTNFQGTMYLDSLHIGKGPSTFERYALFYEDKFCYGNHLKGHDAWGYPNANTVEIAYANNVTGNILSLPTLGIQQERFYRDVDGGCTNFASNIFIQIGGNNWAETPDKEVMKRGVLKRIIYPTGGYVDFDLELNQYAQEFVGQFAPNLLPQLSGGLRVRAINSYDANGKFQGQKYYRYGMLEEGSGLLINSPTRTMEQGKFHFQAVNYDEEIVYLRGLPPSQGCSSPSCLSVVTRERKTTYEPASALDFTYAGGAPIYYQKVTEYRQDHGQEVGRTVYEYYPPDYFYDWQAPWNTDQRVQGTNINYIKTTGLMGVQKSITTYKADGNFGYRKTNSKKYEYERYLHPVQARVAYAFMHVRYAVVEGTYTGTQGDIYSDPIWGSWPSGNTSSTFIRGEYGIPSATLLQSKVVETAYEDNDSLQTVTEYIYNNLPYLNVSSIRHWNSKGEQTVKSIKYPYNMTGTVYSNMVTANRIDVAIETVVTNLSTTTEVSREKTEYADFSVGFGLIAPSSVVRSVNGGPLRIEMAYDEYDQYGNVLQSVGLDGVPVSYLWGYWSQYPVAVLKGIKYDQIPSSYKNNVQINNPSSDSSLFTLLDGLRTHFPLSEITTYAYKPLIGITQREDARGRFSYYDYDGIGRLYLEKDHDQKILARYDYHTTGARNNLIYDLDYTNVPVLRSNDYECSPGNWAFFNRVYRGGELLDYFQGSVDLTARNNANLPEPPDNIDPVCLPANEMARLYVYQEIWPGITTPSLLELDLIRDGSIVATYSFFNPPTEGVFRIPPGDYQFSVRVNADINYENAYLYYQFFDGVNADPFEHGTTQQLEAGKTYYFEIF